MRCKHCGVGLEYYSTIQHAHRNSCQMSESGFHFFVTNIYYIFYTVYLSCWRKTKQCRLSSANTPPSPSTRQ